MVGVRWCQQRGGAGRVDAMRSMNKTFSRFRPEHVIYVTDHTHHQRILVTHNSRVQPRFDVHTKKSNSTRHAVDTSKLPLPSKQAKQASTKQTQTRTHTSLMSQFLSTYCVKTGFSSMSFHSSTSTSWWQCTFRQAVEITSTKHTHKTKQDASGPSIKD